MTNRAAERADHRPRSLARLGLCAAAAAVAGWGVWQVLPGVDSAIGSPAPNELEITTRAIEFYEAKYAGTGGHPVFGHRLIDLYTQRFAGGARLDDVRRAEQIARGLLEGDLEPSVEAVTRARLSNLLLTQHRFEESYDEALTAVGAAEGDATLSTLFDAALAVGDIATARQAFDELDVGSVTWLLRAARLDEVEGRSRAAADRMRAAYGAIEASPAPRQTAAWAATRVAGMQLALGDPAEARAWYERALEISPDYRGGIEGLADLAYADGKWQRAREGFDQILSDAHPDLYLRAAEVSRALGDEPSARRYERHFVRSATDPADEALYAHSIALFYSRNPETLDEALEVIERDLDRRLSPEGLEIRAWLLLAADRPAESLESLAKAARLAEPGADAAYMRALAFQALDREADARAEKQAALEHPYDMSHHTILDYRGSNTKGRSKS